MAATSEDFRRASVLFAESAASVAVLVEAISAVDPDEVARGGALGFGLAQILSDGANLLVGAEAAALDLRSECDRRAHLVADHDAAMAAWYQQMHMHELAVTAWEFDYNAWLAGGGEGPEPQHPPSAPVAPEPLGFS